MERIVVALRVEKQISEMPPPFLLQIFFRNGVLSQLESQRDERLAGMVVNLQAHCRGYLARRRLAQRKLQDLAVRCIQRNVRKFLMVRDWPWWRLLVRVTPLLNVHRTEEELRMKTVIVQDTSVIFDTKNTTGNEVKCLVYSQRGESVY
jgi:myosin-18